MLLALLMVPLGAALLALALPTDRLRAALLPVGGAVQLGLVLLALRLPETVSLGGWLALDGLGRLILLVVSVLFFFSAIYTPRYLAQHAAHSNRVFVAGMFAFLAMMTLVSEAHHLGLMWVAIEATTLTSAPLIYFEKSPRSLEATWKYLVLCSVGIAIALLGTFFLAYSALQVGLSPSLALSDLLRDAPHLSRPWLHTAFVLLIVGYGTKMGLAPMHAWLPDAHSEAPSPVSALLSGALLNCAFLAILRFFQICGAAHDAGFARHLMILLGLVSIAVAAVFMIRQRDYKRMLAYSSIEHMGILVLGVGIGGAAVFGALLHVINNGLTKGVLFLSAGNIHLAYGTKEARGVTGALRRIPISAALFLIGFLAITGAPPFGPFLSEFTIVRAAFARGRYAVVTAFLVLSFVILVGMGATVLSMVHGSPPGEDSANEIRPVREPASTVWPIVGLASLVLLLGVFVPGPLANLLHHAASLVEVSR